MKISVYPCPNPNLTFEEFKQNLKKLNKYAVVKTGLELLWDKDFHLQHPEKMHLLESCGPEVILLALSIDDDTDDFLHSFKGYKVHFLFNWYIQEITFLPFSIAKDCKGAKFEELVVNYLSIQSSLLPNEQLILKSFQGHIPEKYLKPEYLSLIEKNLPLSLLKRKQSKKDDLTPWEFVSAYKILNELAAHNQDIFRTFTKLFGMNLLHLFRGGLGLLSIAEGKGDIDFQRDNSCQELIKEKWDIDIELVKLLASKICWPVSQLKSFLDNNNGEVFYGLGNPLYDHPIIYIDDNHQNSQMQNNIFIVPDPYHYLRSFKNWIFANIKNNKRIISSDPANQKPKDLNIKLSDGIEDHIGKALSHIFRSFKTTPIQRLKDKQSADFHISLPECDLIIEVKKTLGNDKLLSGINSYEAYVELYNACQQCAESIQIYKKPSKPIIAVILYDEYIAWEAMPFQFFAIQSGIMEDLQMDGLEIMSWYSFELMLARTSVQKFSQHLVEKWGRKRILQPADLVNSYPEADNTPAHQYEYLKEAADQICQGLISI